MKRSAVTDAALAWGLPAVLWAAWAGLALRRSSNPALFGRYSLTAFGFLLASGVLAWAVARVLRCAGRRSRVGERLRNGWTWRLAALPALAPAAGYGRNGWSLAALYLAAWLLLLGSAAPRRTLRQCAVGMICGLFSVALTLGLLELVLALARPVPAAVEFQMYYEPDPFMGYRPRPFSRGQYQRGIPAVANRYGHRDREVPLRKPAGVYRVLCLGDSFTMGYNVRQEESYPKLLEAGLNRWTTARVEVVNAAVSGWQPFQYAQYYEQEGRAFEPDLVLVGFFVGNDAYDATRCVEDCDTAVRGVRLRRATARHQHLARWRLALYDHSNLVRLLMNRRVLAQSTASLDFTRRRPDDFPPTLLAIQRGWLANHRADSPAQRRLADNAVTQLRRIQEDCRAEGRALAVFFIPNELQLNAVLRDRVLPRTDAALYDFDMPQSMLREQLGAGGLATLDPLPALRAATNILYMNDAHWNPEAHRLAAEFLLHELPRVVPGFPAPAGATSPTEHKP